MHTLLQNSKIILFLGLISVLSFHESKAQITISRSVYGFDDSRFYFTGAWRTGDSLLVGVPSNDSDQMFDFSSIYFDQTYPAQWSEDTSTQRAQLIYSNASEIQTDLLFMGFQSLDTTLTYYSSTASNSTDTLWYHGFEDQMGESAIPDRPIPLLVFPISMGSRWAGSTTGNVDGNNNVTISIAGKVDAFGTLILPSGSFPALRILVTINFTNYQQYRYYYVTSSPYVSACFITSKSSNPNAPRQYFNRGMYTGPSPKYDHDVTPNLIFLNFGPGIVKTPIGTTDTIWMDLWNAGDTTSLIDSIYLSPTISQLYLMSDFRGLMVGAKDSLEVQIMFRPYTSVRDSANFLVNSSGMRLETSIVAEGITSAVSLLNPDTDGVAVFPNPSRSEISVHSLSGKLVFIDPLGRSYMVPHNGNQFDISSLPRGIYFISNGIWHGKFVKE